MKKIILSFAALLFAGGAFALDDTPFTVLSNNTDKENKYLYVEIMYEKPSCNDAQARFFLKHDGITDSIPRKVVVLNNPGTFDEVAYLSSDSMVISRPTAAGYRLRVPIPAGVTADLHPRLCVASYSVAYKCEGCGVGGSDAIFNESSINPGCPYDRSVHDDILACYERKQRGSGRWEAWIQDPRDCQPYRVVYLRDGRWWFAQNLNYQEELEYSTEQALLARYTCPSGKSFFRGNVFTTSSNGFSGNDTLAAALNATQSCKTYGALYSWRTAMALDGRTAGATPVPLGQPSTVQGICPEGWFLPSDFDWGTALNAMEDDCSAPFNVVNAPAPCNHNYDHDTSGTFGVTAFANIKATVSCPPHALSVNPICANATNPAWVWHRADYNGKTINADAMGLDKWGFSLLPSGFYSYDVGGYSRLGVGALFWTSTEHSVANAWGRYLDNSGLNKGARRSRTSGKATPQSVRCVR